jgi:hypothetical protein
MKLRRTLSLVLMMAAVSGSASIARASESIMGGGYTIADFPMGDWGEIAGFGLGIDGSTIVHKRANKPISARTNLGLLYNFSRTQDIPQANLGPNSALSLETKNASLFFGLGPEFAKIASAATPFIFGTVGFQTFWTSSTLSGTAGGVPYESKNGDSRIAFAWTAGLGIRKRASIGLTELSVEWRAGGEHFYILPSEVTNNGSTVNAERKSRASDQIVLRLGTVLGGEGY